MCFDTDSEPPVQRISGAAVSHDDLTLTAADGNSFAAFLATPDEPATTGVVILPDVRGLYHFYEELALRFAERGHAALAIDYFGRTAGAEKRDDEFEYMPHVEQTTDEGVQADTRVAVDRLRAEGATAIFTVGFCFGGRPEDALPDLVRVVLDPPRPREVLLELAVAARGDVQLVVQGEGSGARRALVDREDHECVAMNASVRRHASSDASWNSCCLRSKKLCGAPS